MKNIISCPKKLGILSAGLGLSAFLFCLVLLNGPPEKVKKSQTTHFSVNQQEKAPVKKIEKMKPKTEKKVTKSLKPKLNLTFQTHGSSLGLDIALLNGKDSQLLSQSEDVALTENMVDQVPVVSHREPVEFPSEAKEKSINGFVTLNLLVDKQGAVDQVKLLESQPQGIFEDVAVKAVKAWLFEPARLKGQKVSVWVKQKINFQVN